ncbi:MAG TPA: lipid-binding SYLF domain-containing protein [Bryobacteraceae bacterium]|jgi:lipid-binding SYLF domain-containing protein|nr:lipid-binding SYLF domain-containing protein [Bryobacteraceae bacterium]
MRVIHFLAVLALTTAMLPAQDDEPDKRLRNATDTLREIMATPDKAIPRGLINRARCMVVVPGMKKAAFVVGGQYGRGFALCRSDWGWSAPAPVRLTGGSFGVQLGADSTDLVFLVMNERGMKRLLSDKFKIGADAAVAAGPVGRDAAADTDVLMRAEILCWSRTHGLFAGASLDGTVVEHDESEAKKLYGRPMSNHEIISGDIKPPEAAVGLVDELRGIAPEGARVH